jgi:CheY-like chemotaxis protein
MGVSMSDQSNLLAELIKVLPGLLMAVVVIVLLLANADAIARLLRNASRVKALGIEIEASAVSLNKAIELHLLDDAVSYRDRMAVLRRLSANAALLRGARALWVDDQPANNLNERTLLESLDVRVDLVTDSGAAEQSLRNHRYLLMVTDIRREARDDEGIRFVQGLAAKGLLLPAIGYTGTDQSAQARPAHFFGMTHRPDHLMQLVCDVAQREGH